MKYPGQETGRIDERTAEIVDLIPTIADVLHEELPWKAWDILLGAQSSTC